MVAAENVRTPATAKIETRSDPGRIQNSLVRVIQQRAGRSCRRKIRRRVIGFLSIHSHIRFGAVKRPGPSRGVHSESLQDLVEIGAIERIGRAEEEVAGTAAVGGAETARARLQDGCQSFGDPALQPL